MPPSQHNRSGSDAGSAARSVESTRQRLLDAAEQLFAERGFEGASMRALAARAGTSVSAANYHFGGKQALMRAVLVRRLEPLNKRRLEQLARVEQAAAPAAPRLEDVLETFFRPSLEAWRGGEASGGSGYRHVLAQLHADPHEMLSDLKAELFGPLFTGYVDVLCRILSDQDRGQVRVGMSLVVGMLLHVIGGHFDESRHIDRRIPAPIDAASGSAADTADTAEDEWLLNQLIAFAAAGLRSKTPVLAEQRAVGGRQ